MGGDLSAERRVPVPMRGRWRTKHPSPPNPANQTTGATRAEGRGRSTRRGKRSAHANGGRTTAHARRPRTQPRRGPRPQLSRPASGRTGAQLFFAPLTEIDRIAARQRHGEKWGVVRGEKNTAGAAAKNAPAEPTPDQTPEQPPTTAPGGAPRARKRAGSRTTARQGDAKQSAASGQAAQADDGETASGRGSRPTPPHTTARREPRQRTAKRRRDGRRRRRPGGNRTREPSRRPKAASAEKRRNRTPQHARDRRGGRFPRRPRAAARTHAGRGHLARTRRRPASRERNGPTPNRRAGARKPGQGHRGQRQERRRAHRPAKRREQRERREPPARSWPAAAATLGREACAKLCRQPFPCPLSCVLRVWVE